MPRSAVHETVPEAGEALRVHHKQRVCPHIGIRGVPPQTWAAADWNKRQFADHTAIRGQDPNNEPVTLFGLLGRRMPQPSSAVRHRRDVSEAPW
ncbi:MAG: hypothetical protein GX456_08215 [Verrucomicrobia bacterium]|nr:hypothetical protein [Verrucomicrobiota bacterium]